MLTYRRFWYLIDKVQYPKSFNEQIFRTLMKTPKSTLACAVFLFLIFSGTAQTRSLSALSPTLYFSKEKTILESTVASENHKILLSAVQATDLEDVLEQRGPFTFFAPSDNAFSKFDKEELKALFNVENKKKLKALLSYHIVAGNLTASKILRALCQGSGTATFTTIEGAKVAVSMEGMDIVLTDSLGNKARITVADSNQKNGVIHEIDRVILPSKM